MKRGVGNINKYEVIMLILCSYYGMSYEEFKKKTDNLILPMLGYIAVANIQGVEIKDASAYFLFSYLGSAL